MKTLKLGMSGGSNLDLLCQLLGVNYRENFDSDLDSIIKKFQESHDLVSDGIVGYNTWKAIILSYREKFQNNSNITDWDYSMFAQLLGCDPACLKAVQRVETGGKGGFEAPGKPQILFEGHVFYRELKALGKDVEALCKTHPNIVYKNWTKGKYLGGIKEWSRLEEAMKIDRSCAIKSASWGMFQIMGNNYKNCGCGSVEEFYNLMCKNQFSQFMLGMEFMKRSNLVTHLISKNWSAFARGYNGPGYAVNKYDSKLKDAYLKYSRSN